MKIVIDIPEEVYSFITTECKEVSTSETSAPITHIIKGILSGQVLPKGYGDLIDRDKLRQSIKENFIDTSNLHYENLVEAEGVNCGVESSLDNVNNAPTVIKADKEDKE